MKCREMSWMRLHHRLPFRVLCPAQAVMMFMRWGGRAVAKNDQQEQVAVSVVDFYKGLQVQAWQLARLCAQLVHVVGKSATMQSAWRVHALYIERAARSISIFVRHR